MSCTPRAVRVRDPAPDFWCEAVIQGRFEERSLSYYMKHGQWLMIFFIPMAFSFVCPTEVLAFDNVLEEFTEQNCSIVFVSTDSKYSLHSWQTRPKGEGGLGGVGLTLLSDQSHRMSKAYGVLVEEEGIALRGRFIINPMGIVKHISVNDVAVGRSVLESLRLLQAYKAEFEHGVLCAANWRPGDHSLVPTKDATQEYVNREFGTSPEVKEGNSTKLSPQESVVSLPMPTDASCKARLRSFSMPKPADPRPATPRIFGIGALQKVFGNHEPRNHGDHISPKAPTHNVEESNRLNRQSDKAVKEHQAIYGSYKKAQSQGSLQNYFDFEPFPTTPMNQFSAPMQAEKTEDKGKSMASPTLAAVTSTTGTCSEAE